MLDILQGDAVERLRELPDCSVQMSVTSPPYWGLRSYLPANDPLKPLEIGTEKTPEEYVAKLVALFREVNRVLKKGGVLWLNLGDCYAGSGQGFGDCKSTNKQNGSSMGARIGSVHGESGHTSGVRPPPGYKVKDLVGVPWMVAFALRADGWYLRSDNIWNKPNPMPESVTDRCTRAHEYLFHFSKSKKYYYDREAIKEQPSPALIKQIEEGYNGHAIKDYLGASVQDASETKSRIINGHRNRIDKQRGHGRRHQGFNDKWDALTPAEQALCGSNKRSVWTIAPATFKGAHFATFPPDLIKPCILAGSRPGDTVLDPFGGSGTSGQVALELGRKALLIELNPDYIKLIEQRCRVTPGLQLHTPMNPPHERTERK